MKKVLLFVVAIILLIWVFELLLKPREAGEKTAEKYVEKPVSTALRAIQAEAKENLMLIAKREAAFYAERGYYTQSLDSIGVSLPSPSHYSYYISKATLTGFEAVAKGNIDNDPIEDYWIITQDGEPRNIVDDATE
jgi:hypothetical protein